MWCPDTMSITNLLHVQCSQLPGQELTILWEDNPCPVHCTIISTMVGQPVMPSFVERSRRKTFGPTIVLRIVHHQVSAEVLNQTPFFQCRPTLPVPPRLPDRAGSVYTNVTHAHASSFKTKSGSSIIRRGCEGGGSSLLTQQQQRQRQPLVFGGGGSAKKAPLKFVSARRFRKGGREEEDEENHTEVVEATVASVSNGSNGGGSSNGGGTNCVRFSFDETKV